jgi:hypothetical protein
LLANIKPLNITINEAGGQTLFSGSRGTDIFSFTINEAGGHEAGGQTLSSFFWILANLTDGENC